MLIVLIRRKVFYLILNCVLLRVKHTHTQTQYNTIQTTFNYSHYEKNYLTFARFKPIKIMHTHTQTILQLLQLHKLNNQWNIISKIVNNKHLKHKLVFLPTAHFCLSKVSHCEIRHLPLLKVCGAYKIWKSNQNGKKAHSYIRAEGDRERERERELTHQKVKKNREKASNFSCISLFLIFYSNNKKKNKIK